MNELLTIIVDLGLDTLSAYDPIKLLNDISLFLNCYQLQSAHNTFRLYAAYPEGAYLLFPIEEDQNAFVKRMAMGDIIKVIADRFEKALTQAPQVYKGVQLAKKKACIASAMMKAVCFSRSWIEEVTVQKGQQFTARILVIQGPQEDPSQHTMIVNSIFACQKLRVNIDGLILHPPQSKFQSSSLIQQAAFLTNGTIWEIENPAKVFPTLLEVFLSNVIVRQKLRLPIAESSKSFNMSSQCIACQKYTSLGYACSFCLSLYCAPTVEAQTSQCHTVKQCLNCGKELSSDKVI
ncbi:hypothetical protein FGO68_gene13186 [Halteria grandinella]|uniref:Uncharacterized protein n=1 Tax=Halteria grandinella TaxID=5974 RepID=A0A8J8NJ31_HALGN|nr:hypothetical protein FGO68_gene13186 [Halteria grandinella]